MTEELAKARILSLSSDSGEIRLAVKAYLGQLGNKVKAVCFHSSFLNLFLRYLWISSSAPYTCYKKVFYNQPHGPVT